MIKPMVKPNRNGDKSLQSTGLQSLSQDLLEELNMVDVHEGVMLARDISECGTVLSAFNIATTVIRPRLELVVEPISFGALERDSVEYIQSI